MGVTQDKFVFRQMRKEKNTHIHSYIHFCVYIRGCCIKEGCLGVFLEKFGKCTI